MPTRQTSKPSARKEATGVDRLYKRVGVRVVAFYYQYPDGTSETFGSAALGDRQAIMEAERIAKRKALDVQNGQVISGSAADGIDRFKTDMDASHYKDQSKDGLAVRNGTYANLTKFFGQMHPSSIKTIHGYQYVEARTKAGAPAKAWKELAQFSTICHKWVEWGIIEQNPLLGMRKPKRDKDVRTIERSRIVKFYLWSQRQDKPQFKVFGCAAMFTYLTGFRAFEVRPFHRSGLTTEGVKVINAKRKKGAPVIVKLREWSPKLRVVVKRADQAIGRERMYLFANSRGSAYSKSGWGSVWQDAMLAYIGCDAKELVEHDLYFSLLDVRPAAITTKLRNRDADAYDFAAHANASTTHKDYDRRTMKKASATE